MVDQEAVTSDRMGMREYLVVLRRRWRMVTAVLVAVVLLALGYSFLQTPQYLASADVLIEPSAADIAAAGTTDVEAEEISTQVQVVSSLPVARRVRDQLSLSATPNLLGLVSVEAVGNSRIIRVTARDSLPRRAATTANAVAQAYLAFRADDSARGFEQASRRLSERQAELEGRLDDVETQLSFGPTNQPALEAERRTLLTQLGQIASELDSLQASLSAAASGGELLQAADTPNRPVSPRPVLTGILAGFFGLLLGAAAALLRDRFDDVLYDEDMTRRALGGSVMLGRIPRWPEQTHRGRLIALLSPHSAASEAYQRLGVNVRFLLATARRSREAGAVVVTTSAQTGEGKTVTACNLAVAGARLGLRVVLVDADLRRAGAAGRFGLGDPPGLSDLLASDDGSAPYLVDVGVERLRLLPAGTIPPNPAALLGSARMRMVLAELTSGADLIVIDSPPVLAVADTLELTNLADQVVVVAREGVTRRRELVTVMESLRHVSTVAVGGVYNGAGDGGGKEYSYTPRERVPMQDRPTTAVDSDEEDPGDRVSGDTFEEPLDDRGPEVVGNRGGRGRHDLRSE